jgi:hypothetical protein
MLRVVFEPTNPVLGRAKTFHVLDRETIAIGCYRHRGKIMINMDFRGINSEAEDSNKIFQIFQDILSRVRRYA